MRLVKSVNKYLPQIVALLFLAGFAAWAWTEPTVAPPSGNVEPPINTGSASQIKAGALGVGGVLQAFSNLIVNGNVGIGTTNPSQSLDIVSNSGDSAIHFRAPAGTIFTNTYNLTRGEEAWVVPPGVSLITVDVKGAQGAKGESAGGGGTGGTGGKGARVTGTLSVTAGETLYIYVGSLEVGGIGGFNGGGVPGGPSWCGDGGCNAFSGGGGGA